MKKWLAFLLCAFVLLALSCALAETEVVAAIPSMDRITVNNRYGLAFTTAYDEDEALLTIRFNAEDTDWDKVKDYVLTHSREEYSHLAPDIWLEKPKNATKARWWVYTGGQNDDQLYSLVQNEPATSANETCYSWLFAASCVKEGDNYTVMPVHCAVSNKCVFACQWLDSRGREVAFEKLYLAVEWDSLKAVPLPGSEPVIAFPAADRVFWSADSGIVFAQAPSYDETTGLLHAVIDTDKTDWPTVIANHFSPALGNVHAMNIGFYPPEGAEAVCSTRFGGGVILNADVLENLGNTAMYNTYPSCEAVIGQYQEESLLLRPVPADQIYGHGTVACWYDANGNRLTDANGKALPYESVHFDVQYTSLDPVFVTMDKVSAACILPDESMADVTAEKADGSVKYTNAAPDGSRIEYHTTVLAPANAENDWTAYEYDHPLPLASGHERPAVILTDESDHRNGISTGSHSLTWKNSNGTTMAVQQITVEIHHGEPRLWPYYVDGLEPFPEDAVTISTLNPVNGATLSYDPVEGIARMNIDSAKVIAAAQTSNLAAARGDTAIRFTPPKGTVKYAFMYTGNDILYGAENNDWFIEELAPLSSQISRLPSSGVFETTRQQNFFNSSTIRLPDGSRAEYYTSPESDRTGMGGYIWVFYWYDSAGSILGKNYICFMYDNVNLITTSEVLEDEDDLSDSVNGKKKPLIIADGKEMGYGQGKLTLRVEQSPSSPGTHRYELTLKSDENAEVELKGTGTLYLPYPDGYDENTFHRIEITIAHYNAAGTRVEETFSVADGTIQCTKHGLRIEVKSLSPFVVSWQKKPASPLALPASLTKIQANAFRGSDFTSVYVPDGCTAIGSGAFAECLRLEEVSIPETLTDIAQDAFPEYAEITVRK